MDSKDLAHTEISIVLRYSHQHHHHLPQDCALHHLQEVDRCGGVVAVVIVDICHTAGVALPVHEGDDGHEVEGERHERHPQLAQGIVES